MSDIGALEMSEATCLSSPCNVSSRAAICWRNSCARKNRRSCRGVKRGSSQVTATVAFASRNEMISWNSRDLVFALLAATLGRDGGDRYGICMTVAAEYPDAQRLAKSRAR